MELPVTYQLIQAAASIVLGTAAGFLYDVFRVVRRRLRWAPVTWTLDLLFWVIMAAGLFLLGVSFGEGKHRIFMTVLAFLGGTLYFVTVSQYMVKLCSYAADVVAFLLRCIYKPIGICWAVLKKITRNAKNFFIYIGKCYTIKHNKKRRTRREERGGNNKEDDAGEVKAGRYNYEAGRVGAGDIRVGNAAGTAGKNRRRKGRTGRASGAGGRQSRRKRADEVRHRQ